MAEISERQERLIRQVTRTDRPILIWGCVLMLIGCAYGAWGAIRFNPRAPLTAHVSFDRPVSQLALLYRPYQRIIALAQPRSDLEGMLKTGLEANIAFSMGLTMTLIRVFAGLLVLVMGMVALTVRMERRRLLSVIHTLRAT